MKNREKRVYKGSGENFQDLVKLDPKVRLNQIVNIIESVLIKVENVRDSAILFIGKLIADFKREYPSFRIKQICIYVSNGLKKKLKSRSLEEYWRLYQKLQNVLQYARKKQISWRALRYIGGISDNPYTIEYLVKQTIKHRWTLEDLKREYSRAKVEMSMDDPARKRGGGRVKCLICDCYPEKGVGVWFYLCGLHEHYRVEVEEVLAEHFGKRGFKR